MSSLRCAMHSIQRLHCTNSTPFRNSCAMLSPRISLAPELRHAFSTTNPAGGVPGKKGSRAKSKRKTADREAVEESRSVVFKTTSSDERLDEFIAKIQDKKLTKAKALDTKRIKLRKPEIQERVVEYWIVKDAPTYTIRSDFDDIKPGMKVLEAHQKLSSKDGYLLPMDGTWFLKLEKTQVAAPPSAPHIGTRAVHIEKVEPGEYMSYFSWQNLVPVEALGRTILIRNLPAYVREDNVGSKLFPDLRIENVTLHTDTRGISSVLVRFETEDEAHKAQIDVHGLAFNGGQSKLWARIVY